MLGIGVDVGGMSVKIGLVNEEGRIINKFVYKTPKDFDSFILKLVDGLKHILTSSKISIQDISGIGIGVPGVVNKKGVILSLQFL
jgi:glucokinase